MARALKTKLGKGPLDIGKVNSALEWSTDLLMQSFDKEFRDNTNHADDQTVCPEPTLAGSSKRKHPKRHKP